LDNRFSSKKARTALARAFRWSLAS
jgi:hypothetical protein